MGEAKCKRGFQSHVMCDCDPVHPLTPCEKVELKPCPFCGGDAVAGSNFDNDHYVMCGADCDKCGGMVGYMKTEMAAIENWNRRTALASGSGDHAELARLAEEAGNGAWIADGDCVEFAHPEARGHPIAVTNHEGTYPDSLGRAFAAFIAAANPATVLALLAENAALRASVVKANDGFEEYERRFYLEQERATEAERKLAEAVEVIEFYAKTHTWRSSTVYMCGHSGRTRAESDGGNRARAFLSKEAEQ